MTRTLPFRSEIRISSVKKIIWKYRYLYLLLLPGIIYLIIFKFGPIWGLLLAFQNYSPYSGFWGSEWVGMKNFIELWQSREFLLMVRNTFAINLLNLVCSFPLPILVAIMLNEVAHDRFKRVIQSIVYLPHFLSWVVIASLTLFIFSTDFGVINKIITSLGGEPIAYLTNPNMFRGLIVGQGTWKDTGERTILLLASMASIDMQLYEAAVMDGAGRLRQIWHITLPGIRSTIITLLILRLGSIFDTGFEQILLMQNALVRDVSVVFDTYAYTQGIVGGKMSMGIAIGLFKSIIGLIFVITANTISKKLGYDGIY